MNKKFVEEIDAILKEKSLLRHPFYKMWSEGRLSLDTLRGYAVEYYSLEAAFPKFLLQLREHGPDSSDDKVLMENYAEETAKGKTHVGLWLDFAEGLGLSRADVENSRTLDSTRETLAQIRSLVKMGYLSGIAALLAYEANLQETSVTKIEGLKKHYGLTDKKSTEFFALHGIVDVKHSNDWRIILSKNAKTEEQREEVKRAVGKSMDALWSFLDGINERYNEGRAC
ncbi:MAG: iron-containing redox enzyme family protein [Candidatus Micrarchaeota archaeon]|nr:iron-containing redox enzyme family protein [Candidatus Micrarchaeota archaeon]